MALRGLLLVVLLFGCEDARTEILVVVDTDLDVPGEIERIEIQVTGPDGARQDAALPLSGTGAGTLPGVLGLVHRDGELGPFRVRAVGRLRGAEVVRREADVTFVRGRTLMLYLLLLRSCRGVTCGPTESCAERGCRPVVVDGSELVPWNGVPDRYDGAAPGDAARDAGVDAGDSCVPRPLGEGCNMMDDDCDGRVDEGFDLAGDEEHCGRCGNRCMLMNATPVCTAGECVIESCTAGFDDCDTMDETGCEVELATDPEHCNACDSPCMVPFATPTCAGGMCGIMTCDTDRDDCDMDVVTGCETDLATDVMHCGGCESPCMLDHATPECVARSCAVMACDTGFDDCDAMDETGCEEDVTTNPMRCGDCDTICAGMTGVGCTDGSCNRVACGGSCTCPMDRTCNYGCAAACSVRCSADATCDVDCPGGSCSMRCDSGATCSVTCAGGSCALDCRPGATCTITSCAGGSCTCMGGGTCIRP